MISSVQPLATNFSSNAEIKEATRSSIRRIAAESIRAGLVYGTSILGFTQAAKLAPQILVDGASPEGILGVGVGVAAALGMGYAAMHTRTAIAEVRRMLGRLERPSFDGDLAARSATLLLLGANLAPALLIASIGGGEATTALLAGGFMATVSAAVGGLGAQVASVRQLREQLLAKIPSGGSGVI